MEHHAYLIEGTSEELSSLLPDDLRIEGVDVQHVCVERFSIDHARSLINASYLRPVSEPYRTFVLVCNDMTTEAQNALLKLLEEPADTARFYLVVPDRGRLLPTLLSRLYLLDHKASQATPAHQIVTDFLRAPYADRLALIQKYAQATDSDWFMVLSRELEEYLYSRREYALLKKVAPFLGMVRSPGASRKMIFEHIALTLPVTK